MSDTPRTYALSQRLLIDESDYLASYVAMRDLARQLEREIAVLTTPTIFTTTHPWAASEIPWIKRKWDLRDYWGSTSIGGDASTT